jgi:hypothetical protein
MKKLRFLTLLLLLGAPGLAAATCHVVTPSGSGSKTGTDWNNAYQGLPSALVRGDGYYLADGNYGSYTFTTTGSTAISISKATASAHCTDVGWNAGTMGSSRAVFKQWVEGSGSGGHYTLTGVVGTFNANGLPTAGSFGIFIDGSTCQPGTLGRCVGLDEGPANTVTFSYIEIQGTGATSSANSGTPDDLLYYGGSSGLTIDHVFMHDSSCDFTFGYGSTNLTVQYSYFYRNYGAGSCHGQVSWNGGTHTGATWRYNTMRTIEGSAIWTAATAGGGTTYDNVGIYGNVIYFGGLADKSDYQCLGDGIFACLNSGVSCNNVQFYNNTMVNLQSDRTNGGPSNCGAGAAGIYFDPSSGGGTATAVNNLWYGGTAGPSFSGGNITENHNSALHLGTGALSGTADVSNASAPNPFITWTGSGNLNAQLSADTSNLNNWTTLSAPFNVDPNKVIRTTDRGAYQYASGTSAAVNPPTNVLATVK